MKNDKNISPIFKLKMLVCYSAYIFTNIAITIFLIPSLLIHPRSKHKRVKFISNVIGGGLGICTLKIFPFIGGYKLDKLKGFSNLPKEKAIYIANHTSFIDPLFMLSLVPNSTIVLKSKYRTRLSIWFLIKISNFIEVDENSLESVKDAEKNIENAIKTGMNVIIFPEGTRGKNQRLGAFKKLAFKLAESLNVDIALVSIYSSKSFFGKNQTGFFPPEGNIFDITYLGTLNRRNFKKLSDFSDEAYLTLQKSISNKDKIHKAHE